MANLNAMLLFLLLYISCSSIMMGLNSFFVAGIPAKLLKVPVVLRLRIVIVIRDASAFPDRASLIR